MAVENPYWSIPPFKDLILPLDPHTHTYTHAHVRTHPHTHPPTHTYTHMHAHIHTHTFIYLYFRKRKHRKNSLFQETELSYISRNGNPKALLTFWEVTF